MNLPGKLRKHLNKKMPIFWKDKLVVLERSVMTRGRGIKKMLIIALLCTLG